MSDEWRRKLERMKRRDERMVESGGKRERGEKREGERMRLRATFEREGTKPGWKGKQPIVTVLFRDVRVVASGRLATDHLWFTKGKTWAELALEAGDVVEFDARVTGYIEGHQGRREEELGGAWSHPTKVKVVTRTTKRYVVQLLERGVWGDVWYTGDKEKALRLAALGPKVLPKVLAGRVVDGDTGNVVMGAGEDGLSDGES